MDPCNRAILFSTCCLPVRLVLAALVWVLRGYVFVHVLTLAGGVAATVFLLARMQAGERVWWRRDMHVVTAALLVAASALAIAYADFAVFPAFILLIDVSIGALTALVTWPFHRAA